MTFIPLLSLPPWSSLPFARAPSPYNCPQPPSNLQTGAHSLGGPWEWASLLHTEPHLVHLSVGSIADHLHQLKDSSRVLGEGERKNKVSTLQNRTM